MNNSTGTFTVGKCLGCVSRTNSRDGAASTSWYVGIQVEQPNGFAEPDLICKRFKLTNDQVAKGMQNQFQQVVGKFVSVPFHTQEWTLDDGRSGVTHYVSNGYEPQAMGK